MNVWIVFSLYDNPRVTRTVCKKGGIGAVLRPSDR